MAVREPIAVRTGVVAGYSLRRVGLFALGPLVGALGLCGWIVARPSANPDQLWDSAEQAFLSGDWNQAQDGLERLDRLRKRTALDWLLRAQVATAMRQLDEAIGCLAHVPTDHPMAAQASLLAGRIERQRGRIARAERWFRQALQLDPDLVEGHSELIYVLGIQSRRVEADAEFRELARLRSLNHHQLFTWALTHFTAWSPAVAKDLERFIQADPTDRASRIALAELLLEQPDEEARVEQILEPLAENDPEKQAMRAELLLNHGKIDAATKLVEQATAKHARLERLRARLALRMGDADGAIRHFRAALGEQAFDRVAYAELGKALLLKGDQEGADRYLTKAKRLDVVLNLISRIRAPGRENEPRDLREIGHACEAAGLVDEALGWFKLAISRDPLDGESQQAIGRLEVARR